MKVLFMSLQWNQTLFLLNHQGIHRRRQATTVTNPLTPGAPLKGKVLTKNLFRSQSLKIDPLSNWLTDKVINHYVRATWLRNLVNWTIQQKIQDRVEITWITPETKVSKI